MALPYKDYKGEWWIRESIWVGNLNGKAVEKAIEKLQEVAMSKPGCVLEFDSDGDLDIVWDHRASEKESTAASEREAAYLARQKMTQEEQERKRDKALLAALRKRRPELFEEKQ